ncbi:MAG: DUF1491 family protein [Candidatus Puniceispirillales bacterium]
MAAQLSTTLMVEAALALANASLVTAILEKRGHPDSGTVLVRLDAPDGRCRFEQRVLDLDGTYTWQDVTGEVPLDAAAAAERISRETRYDPDLWVIAVDASLGDNPFRSL